MLRVRRRRIRESRLTGKPPGRRIQDLPKYELSPQVFHHGAVPSSATPCQLGTGNRVSLPNLENLGPAPPVPHHGRTRNGTVPAYFRHSVASGVQPQLSAGAQRKTGAPPSTRSLTYGMPRRICTIFVQVCKMGSLTEPRNRVRHFVETERMSSHLIQLSTVSPAVPLSTST
jgi:hypothetical protein